MGKRYRSIKDDIRKLVTDFDAWLQKGCTVDNAALLEICDAPVPLYDLVGDEAKAQALREATKRHLAQNKLKTVETKLLVQTWNAGAYRYSTTYDNTRDGGVCGIFANQLSGTVPLYAYEWDGLSVVFAEETEDIKELISEGSGSKQLLGYVYATPQPGTVPLYVANFDGTVMTYCTLTDSPTYGEKGTWEKTGILGYVLPPTPVRE